MHLISTYHAETKRIITRNSSTRREQQKKENEASLPKDIVIKKKFKPRARMLKDQQWNILSDQNKIKRTWDQHTEELCRGDKRMTNCLEEEPCYEESAILKVK